MKACVGLLATASFVACLFPAPAPAVENVSFTDGPGGAIVVQASLDGRPPIPAVVDLGAGLDLVSTRLGRAYVGVTGKYATLRLTSQRADIPYGTILSLAIGPVKVSAPVVGIWNGLDGSGVDMTIGASAFADIATTFDFRGHQLIVEDATTFPDRKRSSWRVPLIARDDVGIALDLFARFDVGGGKTALCQIVTGSQGITFDRALASRLGVDLSNPSLQHAHSPWGDGVAATIPSLALAGLPQSAVAHPQIVFADLIHDCYVGNAFWSARGFTLDIPGRAMYVPSN